MSRNRLLDRLAESGHATTRQRLNRALAFFFDLGLAVEGSKGVQWTHSDSESLRRAVAKGRGGWGSVKWTVVVEYDPDTRHYVATVPGLDIVADAKSQKTAVRLAREAIPLHLEALRERGRKPVSRAKVLQVEV